MSIAYLIQLVSGSDFLVNIIAGLLIFFLEIILIALLLPRIIEARRDRKWRPARQALVYLMANKVREANWIAHSYIDQLQNSKIDVYGKEIEVWVGPPGWWNEHVRRIIQRSESLFSRLYTQTVDEVAVYSPCYTPEITREVAEFLQKLQRVVAFSHDASETHLTLDASGIANDYRQLLQTLERIAAASGVSMEVQESSVIPYKPQDPWMELNFDHYLGPAIAFIGQESAGTTSLSVPATDHPFALDKSLLEVHRFLKKEEIEGMDRLSKELIREDESDQQHAGHDEAAATSANQRDD